MGDQPQDRIDDWEDLQEREGAAMKERSGGVNVGAEIEDIFLPNKCADCGEKFKGDRCPFCGNPLIKCQACDNFIAYRINPRLCPSCDQISAGR